jgi:hypothetical protein
MGQLVPLHRGAVELQPEARKSFFRVQEVEFSWAQNGCAVLILGRVALTPGCQIGYMDHTGCNQLVL